MQILPKQQQRSNMFIRAGILGIIAALALTFNACKKKSEPVHLQRFERELFAIPQSDKESHLMSIQNKYGDFYRSFAEDMLHISDTEKDRAYAPSMLQFISHPSIQKLKAEVDSVFPDLQNLEQELTTAMAKFQSNFPDEKPPCFLTFISEFGYANITLDTLVGIGLDMYLGQQYALYPALEFPDFMVAKLRREYLLPNAIKSMAIGKWEEQLTDKRFLAMLLFEGKVKYFMKALLPQVPDSLIFGYTQKQLDWARNNESMIWRHLIESKMLFNAEPAQYMRYFNDGPFTIATGVPRESAPAIGVFTGYRIIENYMKVNSVSLKELMNNKDWDMLLKLSAYKPL